MKLTTYTKFGTTKQLPLVVYLQSKPIDSDWWTDTLWVERPEDWYALMSPSLKPQRVRVIERDVWLRAEEVAA